MPAWLSDFLGDRIQINSALIVLCFVSVLALSSQSAASYPSYLLALSLLVTIRRWSDVFSSHMVWLVIALLGYLCASSFWSDPAMLRDVFGIAGRSLLVFLFTVALAECQLRGQLQRWLARALAVVGTCAAGGAIAAFVIEPNSHGRLFGLGQLDNPVVAALVFSAVIVLVLQMIIVEGDRRWKMVGWASLVVVLVAVYLTGSRNSWISVGCAAGILVMAHRIKDRQRFVAGVVALLVLAVVAVTALLANEITRDWLLPRGDSFRLDIWSYAIEATWTESRWFGFGILTPDQIPVGDRLFSHPHSMYVTVFYQGGMIGLLLFLVLTAAALKVLLEEYQSPSAKLALGLLALALFSYLLDGHELIDKVGETWFLYWLAIGLALGLQWSRFVDQSD
jgi:O-antigen ligase